MSPPSEDFVVIIGDIVGSRELPDRAVAQDTLRAAVADFNRWEGNGLEAPLKPTGGDEVKAITRDPAAAIDVITRISDALHPIVLAWGIGRGPLVTSWVPDVGDLDGPCFHRARQAVERASTASIWAEVSGFSAVDDSVVNALLRLVGVIRNSWSDRQIQYIRSVRTRSQRETAEAFEVTESAVSQSLQSARFHDVENAEGALRQVLGTYRA